MGVHWSCDQRGGLGRKRTKSRYGDDWAPMNNRTAASVRSSRDR
jgi:hypothetical protein